MIVFSIETSSFSVYGGNDVLSKFCQRNLFTYPAFSTRILISYFIFTLYILFLFYEFIQLIVPETVLLEREREHLCVYKQGLIFTVCNNDSF